MKLLKIVLLVIALLFLFFAAELTFNQMQQYQQLRAVYPAGTTIADIPVGGLDQAAAGTRLAQVFTLTPVELRYQGSVIHIDPISAGQALDLQAMLERAELARNQLGLWPGFWDFLWNKHPEPFTIPLSCSVDGAHLRDYLTALFAGRYEISATAAYPIPGDSSFLPGHGGESPNLAPALTSISTALCSATQRTVEIGSTPTAALPPDPAVLPLVLESLIQVHGFDGTMELYYQDLRSGEEIRLAVHQGQPVDPGIAFTAASTIKVPVMISAYKRIDGEISPGLAQQMQLMIDLSENTSTDTVMMQAIDPTIAPIQVTRDMRALGLQDTFLAGFFYLGAPLLDIIQTPANQRVDVSTDPDMYNQTTAADMGQLLAAVQHCANTGSGPMIQAFEGQVSQTECVAMLDLLASNRKGVLVEAGMPDGTRVAHKYGWVIDPRDGLMHAASDAAIVYTPGGDFILTAYLYHPEQLHWEPAQRLVARMATAINNYYNQWQE
jgi:beta-lactamase class A